MPWIRESAWRPLRTSGDVRVGRRLTLAAVCAVPFLLPATPAAAAPGLVGKASVGAAPSTRTLLAEQRGVERKAKFTRQGKNVHATGWISVAEDLEPGRSAHLLHTADGRSLQLRLPKGLRIKVPSGDTTRTELATGDIVTLDGAGTGIVTVSSVSVTGHIDAPSLRAIETESDRAVQKRTVLVIPINFNDDSSQPITPAALADEFFSTTATKRSVTNFYDRSSRGRLAVGGAVADQWVTVNASRTTCDYNGWAQLAQAAVRLRGVEPDDYDQVQIVPVWSQAADDGCGAAPIGRFRGVSWNPRLNLTWANYAGGGFLPGTAAHEIGHSLGLGHSRALDCNRNSVPSPIERNWFDDMSPDTVGCRVLDNRGDVDVMGGSYAFRPLGGYQRARLGLLPGDRIEDITADGLTHTLTREPTSGNGTGKQLLRLRRTAAEPEATIGNRAAFAYYYFELRAAIPPFDRYPAGDPSLNGVTIHVAADHRGNAANSYGHGGRSGDSPVRISPNVGPGGRGSAKQFRPLVDRVPENGDTTLRAGDSFYDPAENKTITVTSVTSTDAQIKVTTGQPETADAGTVSISAGELNVFGPQTGTRSRVVLGTSGSDIVISDFGSTLMAGPGCRALATYQVACPRSAVSGDTDVNLGDEDDTLWIGPDYPNTVNADLGDGDDAVTAEDDTAVRLVGGSTPDGRDSIASKGEIVLDYGSRTAAVTASTSSTDSGITVGAEGDYLANALPTDLNDAEHYRFDEATIIAGSAADTISVQVTNPLTVVGGLGADTLSASGAASRIVASDGAVDSSITCTSSAVLVRDAADPSGTGCTSPLTGSQVVLKSRPVAQSNPLPATPTFTFAASKASAVFRCKTVAGTSAAGGTWSTCTSPHKPALTADGTYTFVVQALDGLTPGGVELARTFARDTEAPDDDSVAPGFTLIPEERLAKLGEPSGFYGDRDCSTDAFNWKPCGSQIWSTINTKTTSQPIRVRYVDPAGNPSTGTSTAGTIPAQPMTPYAHITSGPTAWTVQTATSASIGFNSSESGSTFECRLSERPEFTSGGGGWTVGAWSTCTSPKSLAALSNGDKKLEVRAIKGTEVGPPTARAFTVRSTSGTLAFGTPSTPAVTTNLTSGTLSWIRWSDATPTNFERSLGALRLSTWSAIGAGSPSIASGAPGLSWTNRLGPVANQSGSAAAGANGVAVIGPNAGLSLSVPASSAEVRTLKLYVGTIGSSAGANLFASWPGGAGATVVSVPSSSTARTYVVSLTYSPTKPSDTLTVNLLTSGTAAASSGVRLYAASVS